MWSNILLRWWRPLSKTSRTRLPSAQRLENLFGKFQNFRVFYVVSFHIKHSSVIDEISAHLQSSSCLAYKSKIGANSKSCNSLWLDAFLHFVFGHQKNKAQNKREKADLFPFQQLFGSGTSSSIFLETFINRNAKHLFSTTETYHLAPGGAVFSIP